jgi:hypothetical protein
MRDLQVTISIDPAREPVVDLYEFLNHQGMWFSNTLEGGFMWITSAGRSAYAVIKDNGFPRYGRGRSVPSIKFSLFATKVRFMLAAAAFPRRWV